MTTTAAKRGRGRPKIVDGDLRVGFPQDMLELLEQTSEARRVPMGQLVRDAVAAYAPKLREERDGA